MLAIGFVPQRLTAIWMGNSDNSEMRGISSALGPGILWRDYMKTVVGSLPVEWYARPDGIVDRTVCVNPIEVRRQRLGVLPGPNCPASFRWTEQYVQGTEPTTDDRNFYTSCGINLRAPFADWQSGLQQVGVRRRLRDVQLRTIQLADLRLRAETERGAVALTRLERPARCDAAAGSNEPAATHAEARRRSPKQNGNSSLDSAA